jgi:phosphoribosyl 1,2-cyclic phosphate phosphodiesterase
LQSADEDGLARPGLARDGHHARARLPRQVLNQREIFDAEGCQRCDHAAPYAKVAFYVMAELAITFLGTGTSQGVPFVACDCRVCRSEDERDRRLRSSILVETEDTVLLVDTTPDLRTQALRHGLRRLDAAVFTHAHTDHIAGFDDLRRFCELSDRPMPVYASPHTMAGLRRMFYYAFDGQHAYRNYIRPEPHEISGPFTIGDIQLAPAEVPHGKMLVDGYIFSRGGRKLAAYFSDCHHVPPAVIEEISEIPVLIIDALRHEPHPSHLSLREALEVSAAARAQRTWLTHIGHDLGHAETEALLPPDVRLAYDGLRVEI